MTDCDNVTAHLAELVAKMLLRPLSLIKLCFMYKFKYKNEVQTDKEMYKETKKVASDLIRQYYTCFNSLPWIPIYHTASLDPAAFIASLYSQGS